MFGLQFYGECWSDPFAEFNYSRDGRSDNYIMNLQQPTTCVKAEDQECVGQQKTNYIYNLTASKRPYITIFSSHFPRARDPWCRLKRSCAVAERKGGAVVRALAFPQFDPSSIPGLWGICIYLVFFYYSLQ